MRLASVSIVLATGLTGGCFNGADLLPPDVAAAHSALWIQDLGTARARAVFLEPDQQPTVVDRSRPLHLLAFDWRPDGLMELGTPFGSVRTVHNQPLPPPLKAYAWLPNQERAEVQLDALTLQSFGLPLPDIDACALQGGCLAAEGVHRCVTPCPASQPAPPQQVDFECPAHWLPTPGPPNSGLSLCVPPVHDAVDCGPDEYQGPGPQCQALADCGSDGALWPQAPAGSGPVVYVDDDAPANGDGSAQRPLGELTSALEIAGARILLAPGEYESPEVISNPGAQIVGRCPSQTRVTTGRTMLVAQGPLSLAGLHIELGTASLGNAPGQALTLRGVYLEGSLSALTVQGPLSAQGLKVRASLGITVRAGSAEVVGFDFVGDQALLCEGGAISLDELRAEALQAEVPTLSLNGCRAATLKNMHIEASKDHAVTVNQHPIDLTIADAIITAGRKNGVDVANISTTTVSSRLDMRRVLFDNVADQAVKIRGMDTVANQIVVLNTRGTAVELRQDPVQSNSVQLNNLWVRGSGEHVVRVGRTDTPATRTTVEGRNWVIEVAGPRSDPGSILMVRDGVQVDLQQVYLAADSGIAIEVACATGTVEDLIILGGDETAIKSQPINEFTVRRMQVQERQSTDSLRNFGVRLETDRGCGRARTTLEDVSLAQCDGCGAGLFIVDGTALRGTRVHLKGFLRAVDGTEGGELLMAGGSIEGNRQGVVLPTLLGVHDRVRGVHFDNVLNVIEQP